MKIKNKNISTRVRGELYDKVKQAAKQENRSVAGLMRYLLYRYVEVYETRNDKNKNKHKSAEKGHTFGLKMS